MTVRTTRKTVTFGNSFVLGDFDEVLPPGSYEVDTDEELLEGLSFHAYRRVLTLIYLPATSGRRGFSRVLTVDPNDLDAALKRDQASAAAVAERASVQASLRETPNTRDAEADRRALARADDEGMTVSSR